MRKMQMVIGSVCMLTLVGCMPRWWRDAMDPGDGTPPEMGGTTADAPDVVLELPIPRGDAILCVQGAYGTWSHSGTSTLHDLDLDTSNVEDQEVYAPVGGVAYVHTESASVNFGYHVNIDLGDGTYIVLGHMSEIFIADGTEVAPGQLLGYEGCTGNCTGDHIHIGRHEGDATLKAEFGTSIEAFYHVRDATVDGDFETLSGDDVVCGIKSEGDPVDGHTYGSDLGVPLWHPDGSLLKTADNAKTYVVEDGVARWLEDEDVFWSQGYDFTRLAVISDEELDCLGTGNTIQDLGLVDAAYDAETGELWMVVGTSVDPSRYRIKVRSTDWWNVLESWGIGYSNADPPPALDPENAYFTAWPIQDGYATFRDGTLMREETDPDVYVVADGTAMPVADWDTFLLLGLQASNILWVDDGAVATVQGKVGDCAANVLCIDNAAVTTCGGGVEIDGSDHGGTDDGTGATDGTGGCDDQDADGHCDDADGGDDCWDTNDSVHPGATDVCGNGIDEDCSGTDLPCPPDETDTDGDGVMDDVDNCPLHDNGDQADTDGDGVGDSCDIDGGADTGEPAEPEDTGAAVEDTGAPGLETLTVTWSTPFHAAADRITLSGEYIFADGSYGFTWRELDEVLADDDITYEVLGVGSGDTFRFSVEYEDAAGIVSWSCIGPYPPGTTQGTAAADVDGTGISITEVGDPTGLTTGCGLFLTVP